MQGGVSRAAWAEVRIGTVSATLVWALAGCTPALDWRESRPEGSGAQLLFPCRPSAVERGVTVAGTTLHMKLHSCAAAGATFSLAAADAGASEHVTALLAALRGQAVANIAGKATPLPLSAIAGATPNGESGLVRIDGRLPDGRPVVEHAAFFVRGTMLYQAAVVQAGAPVGRDALDNFFGAIRLR